MTQNNNNSICWESVRAICIVKTLEELGHIPSKITEKEAWFLSPFRAETQASFSVCLHKNLWYDFGAGQGGSVIDLIMTLRGCSIHQATKFLLEDTITSTFQKPLKKQRTDTSIKIKQIRPITRISLIHYIKSRSIPLKIAQTYCKEVWYSLKGKTYFALGLANHLGGWELRNKYYKNSSSPKSYSFFNHASSQVVVTEGIFDFLSLAVLEPEVVAASDCLILNSLSFIKDSHPVLRSYKELLFYLDNDAAGRKATQGLLSRYPNARDRSSSYSNFKDLNICLTHGKR